MDGVKLVDDTVTPYTFVATIPAGAHTIYATVTDSLGNTNTTLTQTGDRADGAGRRDVPIRTSGAC